MEYAKKLARLVLAQNPKTRHDSVRILEEILKAEGYIDADSPVLMRLKIDVASAARLMIEERKGSKAS